jgi:hypothetical protein
MSVTPELRRLHSPDLLDLRGSKPDNPENFRILVQAMIGPRGSPGEESFDFVVCTPKWLALFLSKDAAIFGRHYLFVDVYDYDVIWEKINQLCIDTAGSTWSEVGERLNRYGRWEFEDYRD